MADGRQMPRIRMPRFGGSQPDPDSTMERETAANPEADTKAVEEETATKPLSQPEEPSKPEESAKPDESAKPHDAAKPADAARPEAAKPGDKGDSAEKTKPGEGPKTPEPSLEERMEGMQGWMAEMERKQARITYFGGLALLLALAAAGAALYFGLTTHSDSASKKDLDALSARVDSLQGAVTKNSKATQNALNASIAQLQQSLSTLQKQQTQAQSTISALQTQVNAAAANQSAAAGATTTATTTTTPGGAKQGK